jgi:hypothetical protein
LFAPAGIQPTQAIGSSAFPKPTRGLEAVDRTNDLATTGGLTTSTTRLVKAFVELNPPFFPVAITVRFSVENSITYF